jgi:AAA15 family ATPase/GTPase
VSKFNSYKGNKKDKQKNPCQLLFTTHDTNIINQDILRKDQIYFVEKNKFEASELFSLADIGERDGVSYSKRYLEGRYGAIPNINSSN